MSGRLQSSNLLPDLANSSLAGLGRLKADRFKEADLA
jgi:hypothetical protein